MRKISVLIMFVFLLCSCESGIYDSIDTFSAKALINVQDRTFISEINEYQISIQGGSLESPVTFSENILSYDGLSVGIIPEKNSVFLLPELVLEILNARKSSGIYNGINYYCEFKNNTTLSEIEWGEVSVIFDYFK